MARTLAQMDLALMAVETALPQVNAGLQTTLRQNNLVLESEITTLQGMVGEPADPNTGAPATGQAGDALIEDLRTRVGLLDRGHVTLDGFVYFRRDGSIPHTGKCQSRVTPRYGNLGRCLSSRKCGPDWIDPGQRRTAHHRADPYLRRRLLDSQESRRHGHRGRRSVRHGELRLGHRHFAESPWLARRPIHHGTVKLPVAGMHAERVLHALRDLFRHHAGFLAPIDDQCRDRFVGSADVFPVHQEFDVKLGNLKTR